MLFIDERLTPAPSSVSFPRAAVTFTVALSDDEGAHDHTLTFSLGKDNPLSWEPLTAGAAPVKEFSEKVHVLKKSKVFPFAKTIFGPASTDLAFFVVRMAAPGTEGSACRIIVI